MLQVRLGNIEASAELQKTEMGVWSNLFIGVYVAGCRQRCQSEPMTKLVESQVHASIGAHHTNAGFRQSQLAFNLA